MNVLSLFDGMSCGQMALERAGISVINYYASEIDKFAIKATKANYPDTKLLECITNNAEWDLPAIDLLIGGSPCQGFSFAGKQNGMATDCKIEITTLEQYQQLKSEGFQFNGQSYLFWEYVDILRRLKPNHFLLENVVMAKKWQDIITEVLGVEPIMINSSLVSAQNRKRLYWCNWHVEQPEDKGILLKDIVESGGDFINLDSTTYTDRCKKQIKKNSKKETQKGVSVCANSNMTGSGVSVLSKPIAVIKNRGELHERNDKSMCLDANYYKGADNHGQRTQIVTKPGYSDLENQVIPTSHVHSCELRDKMPTGDCHHVANATDINGHDSLKRVYAETGKSPTVNTCTGGNREVKVLCNGASMVGRKINNGKRDDYNSLIKARQYVEINKEPNKSRCLSTVQKDTLLADKKSGRYLPEQLTYRKLTPRECMLLQTIPEEKINILLNSGLSNTQLYKMTGNGWTIDVIAHMLKKLKAMQCQKIGIGGR